MRRETTDKPAEALQSGPALSKDEQAAGENALAAAAPHKPKRTLGLWLVDAIIYPITNYFGVFFISVGATYLTEHGWPKPASGKELGSWQKKIGDAFQSRGKKVDAFLENRGWSHKNASMARMVFFSFFDGTFIAPFVKLLEDRREKIAKAIDTTLGTRPNDDVAYEAEPKQSWRSVLEGRFLSSLIVVPTAVFLSRNKIGGEILNDKLFNTPGEIRGAQIEKTMPKLKAGIEKVFGKVHFPYFVKTVYFEAFYTGVTTTGLYLLSRVMARVHQHKPKQSGQEAPVLADPSPRPTTTQEEARVPQTGDERSEAPRPHVTQASHRERLSAPALAAELTA